MVSSTRGPHTSAWGQVGGMGGGTMVESRFWGALDTQLKVPRKVGMVFRECVRLFSVESVKYRAFKVRGLLMLEAQGQALPVLKSTIFNFDKL